MNYTLEFELPGLPPMTNNFRGHWTKSARLIKGWRQSTVCQVRAKISARLAAPLTKATVTLTRHSCSEPDFDGLVSGFKPILDGLVDAGVIANDKPSVIGQPRYLWQRVGRGQGFITVRVEGEI